MSQQRWRSYWNGVGSSFVEKGIQRYKADRGYVRLLNAVPEIGSGGKVLEVGAGKAWQSRILRSRGWHATALDSCRDIVAANAGDVDSYVRGDMYDMPFSDSEFNLVMSCGLIEHCTDVQLPRAISEMARVGNRVVAWLPTCTLRWKLLWKFRNLMGGNVYEETYQRGADELVDIFKRNGFQHVRSGTVKFAGLFPYLYVVGASPKGGEYE